jgi:hypothetical protein
MEAAGLAASVCERPDLDTAKRIFAPPGAPNPAGDVGNAALKWKLQRASSHFQKAIIDGTAL